MRMITHAEYQRFLDERRAAGHYHQPDHWSGYRYPADQRDTPVVGVRPADAVAFCDWLARHEHRSYRYRLPHADEHGCMDAGRDVGYWVVAGSDYTCVIHSLLKPVLTSHALDQQLERDLMHAHAGCYDRERTHISDLAAALDLDLDFVLTRIRNHAYTRSIARDVDIDVAQHLTSRNDRFLTIALALDHQRASTIAHDLAREVSLTEKLIQTLELDINNSIHRAITRDLARNLAYTLDMSSKLNVARALERIQAQSYGHNLDQTGVLARTLIEHLTSTTGYASIPSVTRSLKRALTLARTLAAALDAVIDRSTRVQATPQELSHLLRWSVRLSAFAVAGELFACLQALKEPQRKLVLARAAEQEVLPAVSLAIEADLKPLIDLCLDIYVDSVLLEERLSGNLPAFEGICLVQEQR